MCVVSCGVGVGAHATRIYVYVYSCVMPNVTIYVSQALHDAMRKHQVPVSETCQSALWDEVCQRTGLHINDFPTNDTRTQRSK